MAPRQNNLNLPARLVEEIGDQYVLYGARKLLASPGTRKKTRKAERVRKKALRNGTPPLKRLKSLHAEDPAADYELPAFEQPLSPGKAVQIDLENAAPRPRSILKRTKKADPVSPKEFRSILGPAQISRAVKDKLAEDDDEIAFLEKKLGLKGKKIPQSFKQDGLDELLEGLDGEEDSDSQQREQRKAEEQDWLQQKRRIARKLAKSQEYSIDEDEEDTTEHKILEDGAEADDDDGASNISLNGPEFPDGTSEADSSILENEDPEEMTGEDKGFNGFDSEEDDEHSRPRPHVRENPYSAPTLGGDVQLPAKYIPPSLRKRSSSDSEILLHLRRQTQGLVNRLTEVNLIFILGQIETLYRDNARQHVTSTLVDLLLTSVCEPTSLPDTLIILPAGLIAAIFKIIGTDFGAQVIQRAVELFDEHYKRATSVSQGGPAAATSGSSKETSNLITLLSDLYIFQVVGSNLIFDYIKFLLGELSELNTELLLRIIRTSGPQLRSDDPSSLKDIVAMLRPAVASVGEENISVRTKFMVETINDLKNKKMKVSGVASAVTSEHIIRMKKTLGTLNTRNIKGGEPVRMGLKDIEESDKRGKWWLVGASWSGPMAGARTDPAPSISSKGKVLGVEVNDGSDLAQLAREQRMNTDVRRAIFVAIMSASDYQDANLRLMKLSLKKKQEFEIPKVLIHCAGAEKCYNPYYTLIAKQLCGDAKLKKSFQFSLWDLFRRMGESEVDDDAAEEDEDLLDMRRVVNLGKMFGTLIIDGRLSLSVLEKLNLTHLHSKTKVFLEVMLITLLLQSQRYSDSKRDKEAVVNVFTKVKNSSHLVTGLQYFLKNVVSKTDVAGSKDEKATVRWACGVARDTLIALVAISTVTD